MLPLTLQSKGAPYAVMLRGKDMEGFCDNPSLLQHPLPHQRSSLDRNPPRELTLTKCDRAETYQSPCDPGHQRPWGHLWSELLLRIM